MSSTEPRWPSGCPPGPAPLGSRLHYTIWYARRSTWPGPTSNGWSRDRCASRWRGQFARLLSTQSAALGRPLGLGARFAEPPCPLRPRRDPVVTPPGHVTEPPGLLELDLARDQPLSEDPPCCVGLSNSPPAPTRHRIEGAIARARRCSGRGGIHSRIPDPTGRE